LFEQLTCEIVLSALPLEFSQRSQRVEFFLDEVDGSGASARVLESFL
jgi:hypothetical protein